MPSVSIVLIVFGIIALLAVLVALGVYLRHFVPLRPRRPGFAYVFVEDDGSVRELDDEETEYLSTDFAGADGARPYVKTRYNSIAPDGKMSGFIDRRRVPMGIEIKPVPQ